MNWTNAAGSSVADYHYDPHDQDHIYLTPQDNGLKTLGAHIFFHTLSDTVQEWPAGAVTLTLPAALFTAWDGSTAVNVSKLWATRTADPTLIWDFPKAPEQPADATSAYNYTDNGDGTCTLSNFKPVTGSTDLDFELAFMYRPSFVQVDANGNFHTTFKVSLGLDTDDDGKPNETKDKTLQVDLHTELKEGSIGLDVATLNQETGDAFLTWQSSWGSEPADAKDYFYVVWKLTSQQAARSSIAFDVQYEDVDDEGSFVGSYTKPWENYEHPEEHKSYKNIGENKKTPYTRTGYTLIGGLQDQSKLESSSGPVSLIAFHLKKYPISMLNGKNLETEGVTIKNKVQQTEIAKNGQKFVNTAEKEVTVYFYKGTGSFGKYNAWDTEWQMFIARSLLLDGYQVRLQPGRYGGQKGGSFHIESGRATTPVEPSWDEATNSYTVRPWTLAYEQGAPYHSSSPNAGQSIALQQQALTPLEPGDYYYRGFDVSFSTYAAQKTALGLEPQAKAETIARTLTVYVKTAANNVWQKYATVTKVHVNKEDKYIVQDENGMPLNKYVDLEEKNPNQESYQLYPLCQNTTAIRYAFEDQTFFSADFADSSSLVLVPSTHLKGLLNTDKSNGQTSVITGMATESRNGQQTGNNSGQVLSTASYLLRDLSLNTHISKTADKPRKDNTAQTQSHLITVSVHNGLSNYEMNSVTAGQVSDAELVRDYVLREGTIFDLLPAGTTVDETSIKMELHGTGFDYPALNSETDFTVTFTPNYEESGMTLMAVSYKVPDTTMNDIQRIDNFSIRLTYTLINTFSNIRERGLTLVNSAAYASTSNEVHVAPDKDQKTPDQLSLGKYFGKIEQRYRDLTVYTEANVNYTPITAAGSGNTEEVKADSEQSYKSSTTVKGGEGYSYRLTYDLEAKSSADQIILYDVLETGNSDSQSAWQGHFKRVDISSLAVKSTQGDPTDHLKPVVYYAVKEPTLDQLGDKIDLSDTSLWSTDIPKNDEGEEDPGLVKAVAIDLRKTDNGKDFVLDKGGTLSAYIYMEAPTDKTLDKKEAVNKHTYFARKFSGNQAASTDKQMPYEASARVTVSFDLVDITVNKTWTNDVHPTSGEEVSVQLWSLAPAAGDTLPNPLPTSASELVQAGFSKVGNTVQTSSKTYTWKDLDEKNANGTSYVYAVSEENPPQNYGVSITGPTVNGKTYTFTITNRRSPDPQPEKPEWPLVPPTGETLPTPGPETAFPPTGETLPTPGPETAFPPTGETLPAPGPETALPPQVVPLPRTGENTSAMPLVLLGAALLALLIHKRLH